MKTLKFAIVLGAVATAFGAFGAPKAPPTKAELMKKDIQAEFRKRVQSHKNRLGDITTDALAELGWLEGKIGECAAAGAEGKDLADLWYGYTDLAWMLFRDDHFEKGYAELVKANPKFWSETFIARIQPHHRAIQDFKKFPLSEKEIGFGKTLADFGVADTNVVHLKDYWNPTNVTAAFQKLVNDKSVTTIVLDKMPQPWRVTTISIDNQHGKRILFKSGAELLSEKTLADSGKSLTLLCVNSSSTEIIIESDAERPEDVHIGTYHDFAERREKCKRYGGCGICTGCGKARVQANRNIVIRNLRIADCANDGIGVGGIWSPGENIYVERVIMDSNYRQGTSPGDYYSLYFKDCVFSNTRGNAPEAGVDVEPYDDYLCTASLYFFNCTFVNNNGGGLCYATSTRDPVMCYAKGCTFLPTGGSQINLLARPTRYIAANGKPLSKLVFEDCSFQTKGAAVELQPCPIFDMDFLNCTITDVRTPAEKARRKISPVAISLNRPFGKPDLPDELRPTVNFRDVKVRGFEGCDFFLFFDEIGMLNISDVFKGTVDWNGKPFDVASVRYQAPDVNEPRTKLADPATLLKPAKPVAADYAMPASAMTLSFRGAWWLKAPVYTYWFWAEKGREVSFDLELRYPRYYTTFPTNEVFAFAPSGARVRLGAATQGVTRLVCAAPETGWYRFTPGSTVDDSAIGSGIFYAVTNVKGARMAWQADTESDSFAKFVLCDKAKPYRGYFEVPAGGKECRLRLSFGPLELYDGAGNLRGKIGANDYRGRHTFTIKPSTDKAEIWSFVSPADPYETRGLRFYAPLNGLWADSPDDLPLQYAEHFVPAKESVAAKAEKPFVALDRTRLPKSALKRLGKAVAARKAFAAKREYVKLLGDENAKIARMRALTMNDDVEHQISDLSKNVAAYERIVAMEKKAAAETPEVLEAAAFCQEFAGTLPEGRLAELGGVGLTKGVLTYETPGDLNDLVNAILKEMK